MSTQTIYECFECHATFSRAQAIERNEPLSSEFWGSKLVSLEVSLCCPECGSDDVGESVDEDIDDVN